MELVERSGVSWSGSTALERAAELLDDEQVLVAPTDTVVGLLARATSRRGVERIAAIKGRDVAIAPPVVCASREVALEETATEDRGALSAVASLWPGPLSVIVRAPRLARSVNPARGTVALRVPALAWLAALAEGGPLAASSANRHGQPTPSTSREAFDQLCAGREATAVGLAGYLVAQSGDARRASTILDLTGERPRMVREGATPASAIEAVLGVVLEPRSS